MPAGLNLALLNEARDAVNADPAFRQLGTSPVQSEGTCDLLVQDNGIGFDEKYLDRIFNVFQRLHGRGVYEGTGIGLAVCRKIVERHGGSITARSRPGEGATFVVTLPVRQPAAAGDEPAPTAPEPQAAAGALAEQ